MMRLEPLIIGDNYIVIYDNFNAGSIVVCYDIRTGEIKWKRFFGPESNSLGKSHISRSMSQLSNSSILITGFEYIIPPGFSNSSSPNGNVNQIVLDIRNGETLEYNFSTGFDNRVLGNRSDSFDPVMGSNEIRYLRASSPNTTAFANLLTTEFLDKTTLRKVTPDYQADSIFFRAFDSDGFPPILNVYGPFITPDYDFITLTRYFLAGSWITEFIKTTDRGKLLVRKDISSVLVSGLDSWGDIFFDYDDISDGFRLITSHRLSTSTEYHHGYIDLDFEGNVMRDRRRLEIDGNKVGHMRAIDLIGSEDVLICCRFVDSPDNNVHFYRDTKDGQLIKAGELINNDGKLFANTPQYIVQDDEGSLYINFNVFADTAVFDLPKLNFGGWLGTLKIDAAALGTTVSTQEVTALNRSMSLSIIPNPTIATAEIILDQPTDGTLTVIDLLGQIVYTSVLAQQDRVEILTADLPYGQYVVMIRSEKGIYRGRMIKL